jgi:hypothetical protein
MAINPTNEDLMAYLYGELSKEEDAKIEDWLKKNPEAMEEVEELKSIRGLIGQARDQEVVDPLFYTGKGTASFWQITRVLSSTIIKPAIGLAAAISFLLLVGYMTNLDISTQKGYLTVSFGADTTPVQQIDEQKVASIVQDMIDKQNMLQTSDVQNIEDGLKTQLASYYDEQNNQFRTVLDNNTQSSNQALAAVVRQMQKDNLDYLERYLDLSNRSQEQNLQTVLIEFSEFLAEQRVEDLGKIQYNLTTLKESQDIQKMETDQILATILNTVNNENQN